jgi:bifunctional enzyme CysN/CysC
MASSMERVLMRHGLSACVLDGDVLRAGLSADLGHSRDDRAEHARRTAQVATLLARAGFVAIVALVSPYAEDRGRARRLHDEAGLPFVEIWVNTPLWICQERDPKGLYARARTGQLAGLTGVDAPYETPRTPDVEVAGYGGDPDAAAERLLDRLGWRSTTDDHQSLQAAAPPKLQLSSDALEA